MYDIHINHTPNCSGCPRKEGFCLYVFVCAIQYGAECSTTKYLVVVTYRLVAIVCRIKKKKHAGQDTGITHLFTMLV